jgi:farnesyl diphosphate synthase
MSAAPAFDLDAWSRSRLARIESALAQRVPADAPAGLGEAMAYAVQGGGKRLRPLLVLAAHEAVARGGDRVPALRDGRDVAVPQAAYDEAALRAACAVELIHAYSLVHDDLPCMDDDVLRRGQPTVHVRFGEARAMLAGDGLQALAFELLTQEADALPSQQPSAPAVPDAVQAALCRLLARAAGHAGMVGGQAIDVASVGLPLAEDALRRMHRMKTGALLQASVMMGAACGAADAAAATGLRDYGAAVGLAFQVVDDILDVTADSATLGKTAGKDAAADKPTYVALMGLDRARAHAAELLEQADAALEATGLADTAALHAIARWVIARTR